MAPLEVPTIVTSSDSRPSTPTNATSSSQQPQPGNSPTSPPPTFEISPADDDEHDHEWDDRFDGADGEGSPKAGDERRGSDATMPPSPTAARHQSSLGLRENLDEVGEEYARCGLGLAHRDPVLESGATISLTDAKRQLRDAEVHSLGVAPSTTAYSSDDQHSKHNRRPSAALSFASTIPDTSDDHRHKEGLEHGTGDNNAGSRTDDGAEGAKDDDKPAWTFFGVFRRREKPPPTPRVRPDPSPEEMAPFALDLTPSGLYGLIDPKSVEHLDKLGGIKGLMSGLKTDRKKGLSGEGGEGDVPLEERVRVYGVNRTPTKKTKSLLQLMWMAYQDKVLLILSVAAIVSLALGLYQDLGTPPDTYESTSCANNLCTEPQVDWVEGVAITIAILIVVLVGAVNDWQKERQFQKLNAQKEERNVKVIRNGGERLMSVYDVVVGDVLIVEPGEIVPVDGVFLSGHNVKCDESGATGESDAVRKVSYEELKDETVETKKADCFLISGSKVLEGVGSYVVTGVGESSFHGRLMMALQGDTEETPLQLKLNALAELIAKLGSAAGLLLFGALMIRFFVQLATVKGQSANDKAQNFIQILIIAVTIVVVAVPEGLPLAVTLALAFATRRMTKQNLLVRVLGACETMANATVICTDKTGTLTTNKMSVVAGSIGVHLKFADRLAENASRTNANDDADPAEEKEKDEKTEKKEVVQPRSGRLDFSTDMTEINKHISSPLRRLLNDSIAINSTAFEGEDEHGTLGGFVGSKTETALLSFAKAQEWEDYKATRDGAKVVQMIPFSSERKAMGVVIELPGGGYRLLLKGASEVLAKVSNRHVVVTENLEESAESASSTTVPTEEFNDETRSNISRTIIFYANQSLRTIALCSRDLPRWPPLGAKKDEDGDIAWDDLARDLTLVAITAIEDPLREGVTQAVATCQGAGVMVKMCTGDNVLTARSIALQCGIFTPGGVIMEGPVFRKLTTSERDTIIPRLQVLARSSPEDKKILVEHLKGMGEVVGVSGDGSNDAPALKTANVGFSMGIAGTEVAKEASDIVVMDDNFSSMVTAIMWGRCVNDSVKKFLQFQISVNITAVVITFITAVASSSEESVLTAVQLLWVNLIMDTFAALALATDPADPESLKRKPDRKTAPLITVQMWMMIIGQAIFQIIVALVLHFAGPQIFRFKYGDTATEILQDDDLKTLVFNTFVFCQIFNQLNARRLDRGLNVFVGILKNYYFLAIFCIMVGGQAIIVEFGGAAFQVKSIGWRDWVISIIVGALSLPLAVLIRLLPPGPFERFMIKWKLYPDPNAKLPTESPASEEQQWNEGISKVIDNLNTYSKIRGGRMRSSSIVRKSRSSQMKQHDIHPTSLLAMVPSLVFSSVGAGWRPQEGSLSDPAGADPSKSSVQLFSGNISVHPDTDKNDPLAQRFNNSKPGGRSGGHSRQPSTASAVSGHSRSSSLAVPTFGPGGTLSPPSPSHS
ncbi:Ca2+-transporting ATPase [Pseudohyphozyma bogoriensis]|nr:Ca2+-transporting ATPase [Pseudohyphozyma bogoriensis]